MRKLLSLLLNIVLDLQQKNHEQKVARTLHSYTNGMSKTHISATETLMLNAKSNKLIEETKKTRGKSIARKILFYYCFFFLNTQAFSKESRLKMNNRY